MKNLRDVLSLCGDEIRGGNVPIGLIDMNGGFTIINENHQFEEYHNSHLLCARILWSSTG